MFLTIFLLFRILISEKQQKLYHNHGDGAVSLEEPHMLINGDRIAKAPKEDIMLGFEKR
jgi:hypothetical protein